MDDQVKPDGTISIDGKDVALRVLTIKDIRALQGVLDLVGNFSPFATNDVLDAVVKLICHQAEADITEDQAAGALSLETFPQLWSHMLGVPVRKSVGKPVPGGLN